MAGIVASGVAPAWAKERVAKGGITLEQAWAVHRKCLIIDGHNDTPIERAARKENPINWMKRDPAYQTDIPRMKESGQQNTAFMNVEDNLVTMSGLIDTDPQKETQDRVVDHILYVADLVGIGSDFDRGVNLQGLIALLWLG